MLASECHLSNSYKGRVFKSPEEIKTDLGASSPKFLIQWV